MPPNASKKTSSFNLPSWNEPVGTSSGGHLARTDDHPVEQTKLNVNASILSDYAWYDTDFVADTELKHAFLLVETWQANAFVVYIDGRCVGGADTHQHKEGPVTLNITITGSISSGGHTLSVLSESLGYGNLVGRWGGSTQAKAKGITGIVYLISPQLDQAISLVDGREWRSMGGLHGERAGKVGIFRQELVNNLAQPWDGSASGGLWSSALFDTPRYDSSTQSLFLQINTGRGHLWLNGIDLGRYWNITRGNTTSDYSQQYYFLPPDLLFMDGKLNELVFFDAFGGTYQGPRLVTSWITQSNEETFEDTVGYPDACL